jgi:AcrR family transcriptional regulator
MARRRKADGDSRELILNAAQALIVKNGFDGMAVSDLCKATGLPPTSVYYHFGSKVGVMAALLERTFEEIHAVMRSPSSFEGDPLDRFEEWFTAACEVLDRRPDYLRLLLVVSIGSLDENESVRTTVKRIRDYAYASWIEALTPVFGDQDEESVALVQSLAEMGRALADGGAVSQNFEGTTFVSHVQPFVALVRAFAGARASR